MKDYYQVLGVSSEAEVEVITAAYKAMMRKYHPDINLSADAAAKAQEINEAYETLKDPSQRANYDFAFKKYSEQRSAPPPPPPPPSDSRQDSSDAGDRRQKNRNWPTTLFLGIFAVIAAIGISVFQIPSASDADRRAKAINQVSASADQVTGDAGDAAYQASDYATASREYRSLAERGDAGAQNKLGHMYQFGTGVPQSDTEAVRWYRLAAQQGFAASQTLLGEMYAMGRGVPQDYAEAVRLYRLAAEQGNSFAQANLGAMYFNGDGVPRSHVRAYMWINLAAAQANFPIFLTNRDKVSEGMSRQDISRAQQLSADCLARNYRDC